MGISILSGSACEQFENSNEIFCMDIDNEFSRTFYSISQKNFKPKKSVSLFLDEIKKKFHTPLFEDYLIHISDEKLAVTEEEELDFDTFKKTLCRVKTELPPRQAEVFELCKEQGLTAADVAQQLNISEQAVYNHLSQAMKTIREKMSRFSFLLSIFF